MWNLWCLESLEWTNFRSFIAYKQLDETNSTKWTFTVVRSQPVGVRVHTLVCVCVCVHTVAHCSKIQHLWKWTFVFQSFRAGGVRVWRENYVQPEGIPQTKTRELSLLCLTSLVWTLIFSSALLQNIAAPWIWNEKWSFSVDRISPWETNERLKIWSRLTKANCMRASGGKYTNKNTFTWE